MSNIKEISDSMLVWSLIGRYLGARIEILVTTNQRHSSDLQCHAIIISFEIIK